MRVKPKKRLGQNFLVDKNIQKKIICACGFQKSDTVVEAGAGTGIMTALIAKEVKRVIALEVDRDCLIAAKEALSGFSNIESADQDILKFDFKKNFGPDKVKVFGNIPYYISSAIIESLIKFRDNISEIFITVQKEFAQRVVAVSGSKVYGSLSCFVRYYTEPSILMDIKRGSFFPVPKVDSSLVRLAVRVEPPVKVSDEKFFFRIIRAAFNKRRKTIRNSLEGIVSKERIERFFAENSLSPGTRPERLTLAHFADLSRD